MPFPSLSNYSTTGFRSPGLLPSTSSSSSNDRPRPTMQVKDILRSRQITSQYFKSGSQASHSIPPQRKTENHNLSRFISSFRYHDPLSGPTQSQYAKHASHPFIVNDQSSNDDNKNGSDSHNHIQKQQQQRSKQQQQRIVEQNISTGENNFDGMKSNSDEDRWMNDSDGDDLEDYIDDTSSQNNLLDVSSFENKIAMLRERFPALDRGILLKALYDNNGQFTAASMQLLDTSKRTQLSFSLAPRPRQQPRQQQQILPSTKRVKTNSGLPLRQQYQQRRRTTPVTTSYSDQSSDSEDDDHRPRKMHWKDRTELLEAVQTVRFYNTAKCQDIMDVTGCKLTSGEKLISLRPFDSLQDLHDKLKTTRGLSVQYIKAYMELMEGYSAVDQIIQNIEHTGIELQTILDVWKQFDSTTAAKTKMTAQSDGGDDDDDGDAGTHLVAMDTMTGDRDDAISHGLDPASDIYKDAMDGFLTQQPAIVNPEFNLKSYQILGVNWMLLLYRKGISGILADEMGLGKTAQVISFLGRLYELGEMGPHLIVVPASTLDNWMREFDRFCPTLNVWCYYGTQTERAELRNDIVDNLDTVNVVVTTYSLVAGSVEDRSFLRRLRCKSMILDEGHMIKNYTSVRYGHLMRLNTPFRLLLTGTPLQNNLQELVSLLVFIMPKVFSGNEEDIRKIFKIKVQSGDNSGGGGGDNKAETPTASAAQMLSRQRIQRAKKMMTPFVLRRRKQHVLTHLPQKIHLVEYCTMTPNQHALYTNIIKVSQQRFKAEMVNGNNNGDTGSNSSNSKKKMEKLCNLVMQLRKAADHPLLFRQIYNDDILKQMAKEIMKEERYQDADEQCIYEDMEVMSDFELNTLCHDCESLRHRVLKNEEWMDAGKIQYLQQILPEMKQKGCKVLLFSQFTSMLDIIEMVLETLGLSFTRLDGSTKVDERQSLIDEFNENDSLDVFLLSTKAGGFGINLASANVVVMYDMDFNPQNDKQAEDRAHRVGQTKDVTVYKLLSNHTIDLQILTMAEMRLRLDSSVSGIDERQHQHKQDNDGMDQTKMKSLLKSVLLPS